MIKNVRPHFLQAISPSRNLESFSNIYITMVEPSSRTMRASTPTLAFSRRNTELILSSSGSFLQNSTVTAMGTKNLITNCWNVTSSVRDKNYIITGVRDLANKRRSRATAAGRQLTSKESLMNIFNVSISTKNNMIKTISIDVPLSFLVFTSNFIFSPLLVFHLTNQ